MVRTTGPIRLAMVLLFSAVEALATKELRRLPELFLNTQQLFVLRDAVRARGRASLDLSSIRRDREVRNERVLGLARTVRDHSRVAIAPRQLNRIQRLRDAANLVHFAEDWVADLLINTALQALHVGHEQIIADELDFAASLLGQILPSLPVVFGEAVLDRHN